MGNGILSRRKFLKGMIVGTIATVIPMEMITTGLGKLGIVASPVPPVPLHPSVLMPISRRIYPNLIAAEICGVQPMSSPVGQAFAIRYKPESKGELKDGSI